jgi:hypothetical protein
VTVLHCVGQVRTYADGSARGKARDLLFIASMDNPQARHRQAGLATAALPGPWFPRHV